jgi:hypothetical protein
VTINTMAETIQQALGEKGPQVGPSENVGD